LTEEAGGPGTGFSQEGEDGERHSVEDTKPLAATVARLPLDDALDVYAHASAAEKTIRAEAAQKVSAYYSSIANGRRSEKDYRAMKPRIQKFFSDKP
jgi:hypothetical protein